MEANKSYFETPKKRALLIEGDPYWQVVMRRVLEHAGRFAEIRCVENRLEALAVLETGSTFDVVLADQDLRLSLYGLSVLYYSKEDLIRELPAFVGSQTKTKVKSRNTRVTTLLLTMTLPSAD